MEATNWVAAHWFDLIQTLGIIGSLLLAVHTALKDERSRKISNSLAISEQYRDIWKEAFEHPALARVLDSSPNFEKYPISFEEERFVMMLILHVSTAFRAMKHGEFVALEGFQRDVQEFFSLPIPKAVWDKLKGLQDRKFAVFVEKMLEFKISTNSFIKRSDSIDTDRVSKLLI